MNMDESIRARRIFSPLVKRIGLLDGYLWFVYSFWDEIEKKYKRPFNCSHTAANKSRSILHSFLAEYAEHPTFSSSFKFLSEIIFNEAKQKGAIILSSGDNSLSVSENYKSINIQEDLVSFIQKSSKAINEQWVKGASLKLVDLNGFFKQITDSFEHKTDASIILKNIFTELGIDETVDDSEPFLRYLCWLILHDPTANFWIYIPDMTDLAKKHSSGIVMCFEKVPSNDELNIIYDIAKTCFETINYTINFCGMERGIISDTSIASYLSKRTLLKEENKTNIDRYIRNFTSGNNKDELMKIEEKLIFYPLYLSLTHLEDFRWISAFGFHNLVKDNIPYRIGWDLMPSFEFESMHFWTETRNKSDLFKKMADKFYDEVSNGNIISLGTYIFTKCNNKKPLVILYNLSKERVLEKTDYNHLEKDGQFVFCSFKTFYDHIFNKIHDCLKNVETNNATGFNLMEFINSVIPKNQEKEYLKYLENEIYSHLKKLDIKLGIELEDVFLTKLLRYLVWLVAHDIKTNVVVYFPSTIKPETPAGGVLIGFNKLPSASTLIAVQEFVNNIFAVKGYMLSDLDPKFPEALHFAAFTRRYTKMDIKNGITVAFIDLDYFGKVNKGLGHQKGDEVLSSFFSTIKSSLKDIAVDSSIFCRFGGDELVFAAETNVVTAVKSKLEESMGENMPIDIKQAYIDASREVGETITPTLTAGLEYYHPTTNPLQHDFNNDPINLIFLANQIMTIAKAKGYRKKVFSFSELEVAINNNTTTSTTEK